jgi:hypothetical protein
LLRSSIAQSLLLAALAAASAASLADVGPAKTIASGLANPRGLNFAPNGDLYVAESGSGGNGECTESPPMPTIDRCYGETGAIARIKPEGGFERVITGLPSLVQVPPPGGPPGGTAEGGPVDVSFVGTSFYVTMSWGGDPAKRAALGPKGHMFGSLLHATPAGQYRVLADVARHEVVENPAGGRIDSNPYGTAALPGRRLVADAGANALIEVLANGRTRTFALPPYLPGVPPGAPPREPVPTSVTEGPDGALYVGLLTSGPFWQGTAAVLRIESDGSAITPHVTGLTAVVDTAFDAGGALYILEVASGLAFPPPPGPPNVGLGVGRLLRMCPGGTPEVLLPGLTFSSGVAVGPDQAVYLTNFGTSPTQGEVLRLEVAPCA